jgi:hypothetical protein
VVPQALVLSHTEQLDRLAAAVSEALPNAVVAGDPRFDRITASTGLRARYRAALGIAEHERLVVVTSTWSSRSLFGSWPDLFRQLLAELPIDRYRVAGVLHPHIWYGHSRLQVRLWLADCLRAGLLLVPPAEGWSAALIASDLVVGDHGAVTCYGAAIDKPVLLASFPASDVAAGSCVEVLGGIAPLLDRGLPLLAQIEDSIQSHPTGRYRAVRELISSVPGQAAARHRTVCYQLMGLSEPDHAAATPILSTDGLHPAGHGPRVAAVRASGDVDEAGRVALARHPADVMPARLSRHPVQVDPHLAVHADHPVPTLRGCADIVFALAEDTEHDSDWLTAALHVHPYCAIAAVIHPDHAAVILRQDPTVHIVLRSADGHGDPLAGVSALYLWQTHRNSYSLPEELSVHLGLGTPNLVQLTPTRIAEDRVDLG